jgi:hypothetical protein
MSSPKNARAIKTPLRNDNDNGKDIYARNDTCNGTCTCNHARPRIETRAVNVVTLHRSVKRPTPP